MKNKVIDILNNNSQKSVIGWAVEIDDFDKVAEEIVKLFAISGVVGGSLPDFLYEYEGNIKVGMHGDSVVTDEWNKWKLGNDRF